MKKKVTLVLSGGGARGIAHIGVIEELERRNYEIVSVTGTSMGAMVGGYFAAGQIDIFKDFMVSLDRRKVLNLVDFTLSRQGMVKGDRVFKAIEELIPDASIEDFKIPYAAVAVDLLNSREVVFREGSLFEAIRASVSIPTVLTPVKTQQGLLVDGGVLNNIPISHAPRVDDDLLVVCNVNARIPAQHPVISYEEDQKKKKAYKKKVEEFQTHLRKVLPGNPLEKREQSPEEKMGYFNLINTTINLMTYHMAQLSLQHFTPDVLIEVSRDSCGTYDFFKADEMIEAGRIAATNSLDKADTDYSPPPKS